MTTPLPFQQETVEAALRVFRLRRRYRRFLVADEVGLGKTIVAKEIIRKLMARRKNPLVVFYVCSNLSIAAQNKRQLLKVLPIAERVNATARVDRLTLLAGESQRPLHRRLHLYTLTPDTSIPLRKNRRRDGRQEERALIHALVERVFPGFFREYDSTFFRCNALVYWAMYLNRACKAAESAPLRAAFRRSVRQEFELATGQHLLPAIRDLDYLEIIGHLRNALAATALEELQPDLVIFDEFQRFRDLLESTGDPAEERVTGRLRGENTDNPPALLLLSATPYRLYARRSEDATGAAHHREFFDLVEFLFGATSDAREKRTRCESAFAQLETELRKRQPSSENARHARALIEKLLREVMARTERASHEAGRADQSTEHIPAPLRTEDLRVFKHTSSSFQATHRTSAVPYWVSIPLPMQTMGRQYVAWEKAMDIDCEGVPRIEEEKRDEYARLDSWPHPRLRALCELFPAARMVAPWIAPSAPWWKLGGIWRNDKLVPQKALLFSRFRAVPQAVAASLSFDLEAEFLARQNLPYSEVTKRRLLSASEGRHALLALFHPSPFIVRSTDPLSVARESKTKIRAALEGQVRRALGQLGVRITGSARKLQLWKLLAALEKKAGNWTFVREAWWNLNAAIGRGSGDEGGLAQLLGDWEEAGARSLEAVHPSAVKLLADYSLSAPGVILGRALYRHWPGAVKEEGFYDSLEAAWSGLRNYFDQRWFFSAFRRKKEKYPAVLRRLAFEGNLEAVLDEHLWVTARLRSLDGSELAAELRDGLKLKSGLFFVHPLGHKEGETFSLRCHVAMSFIDARAAYAPHAEQSTARVRTDELRKAFNTPFWPHVLATTSVGQEGLDFHAWCDTIIHWDLCRNPVDLEQREGRIQRYAGLSIRRAIARELGENFWEKREAGESPWSAIERLANVTLSDPSGLAPWWVFPGGSIRRYVFDVPASEQRHWLQWIQHQRLLYRLALGQPNQEDLVELLARRDGLDDETVRESAINLSPWFAGRAAAS